MAENTQQKTILWPDDVRELTTEELLDTKVQASIEGMAVEFINTGDVDEAQKLVSVLSEKLGTSNTNTVLAQRYSPVLRLAEIGSQKFSDIKTQTGLLKDGPLLLIKNDIDPTNFFKQSLAFIDDFDITSRIDPAVQTFEQNTETIGNEPFYVSGGQQQVSPTISNWLKDFRIITKSNQDESVENRIIRYFRDSENYKKLKDGEKEYLKKILRFYNWLLLPTPLFIPDELDENTQIQSSETTGAPGLQKTTPERGGPVRDRAGGFDKSKQPDVSSVKEKIFKLAQKHKLRVDESGEFENEVLRAFNGVTHPNDFMQRLRESLPNTGEEKLEALVVDTNREIFEPARNVLLKQVDREPGETAEDSVQPIRQKLEDTMHTQVEKKTLPKKDTAGMDTDPYREPIE